MPATFDRTEEAAVAALERPNGNAVTWYVDASGGSDGLSGRSPLAPFQTMAKAFTRIQSGDTIKFWGKIREQLITPVQVFDVTVIGMGNRPRHSDDAPAPIGGRSTSTWTTPASGATTAALCKVLQQGWSFENILWAGPSDHACLWFLRDAGSGDDERDASHGSVRKCRFASGQDGIWNTECFNLLIEDNIFMGMTGFDFLGKAGAGVAAPLQNILQDNIFIGSANHVKADFSKAVIRRNVFDDGGTPNTTVVLNTTGDGGSGANCFIYGNVFQTATANFNTPDLVGNATDVWADNISIDSTAAGVGSSKEWGQPA